MACRSFRPRQELANRFEFFGKKIRIPTRGWAIRRARSGQTKEVVQTAVGQPRRWDQKYSSNQPAGRRPELTSSSRREPTRLQPIMACRSFRPRQELANRFEFWGKKIRIPTRGWAVRRARSGVTEDLLLTAHGQPRRWV